MLAPHAHATLMGVEPHLAPSSCYAYLHAGSEREDRMKQIATASLLGVLALLTTEAVGQEFGKFVGNPQTEWDPDGRRMLLLDDFVYVDPAAQKWIGSKGSTICGASFPQGFCWSLG